MMGGVHPKIAHERLRHPDISSTLNRSVCVTMDMRRDAAHRLAA